MLYINIFIHKYYCFNNEKNKLKRGLFLSKVWIALKTIEIIFYVFSEYDIYAIKIISEKNKMKITYLPLFHMNISLKYFLELVLITNFQNVNFFKFIFLPVEDFIYYLIHLNNNNFFLPLIWIYFILLAMQQQDVARSTWHI